jgi:hypothetical protein
MAVPICSVGVSVVLMVSMALVSPPARAGTELTCADGFTKVLEQGGSAVCRRSESVANPDLAEALSQSWWGQASCNGAASDKQEAVSQGPAGDWTVTMRFFCNKF